jgi:hypothetical protein
MPDRLLSLVVLVGCWVPPAAAGWAAARRAERRPAPVPAARLYASLTAFALAWATVWFLINLYAMPPYIPGASKDPLYRPPQAIVWLAVVAGALVLPLSALAWMIAYRARMRRRG